MDSMHMSETQNIPLNCRSTACNTSPAPCGCGLKDYIQTIPPAYCLRALYPGISKCKHFQEKPEEKFAFQQPVFSNLPLFSPFFHNGGFPSNVCCHHNPVNETPSSEEKIQTSEHEKIPQPPQSDYMYCQKEKCDFRMNKSPLEEVQKNNTLGSEKQFLGYPFVYPNLPEAQLNTFFRRCPCGDAIPWACSSLMVPMISYCVFWNSQRGGVSLTPANYSGSSHEEICQRNNENPVNKNYSNCNENETSTRNVKVVDEVNNNSMEVEQKQQGNLKGNKLIKLDWEKEDADNTDQNSVKSSSFLTFDSINYIEGNSIEQIDGCNTYIKNNKDRIEEDVDINADQTECLKLNEKDSNTSLPNDSLRGDESSLSERSRPSSPEEVVQVQGSSSVLMTAVENTSNASISNDQENDSNGESKKNEFMTKASKPHSLKKFIKTFTLIDQRRSALQDGVRVVSDAAAGDLGGSNCYGYKVNISSIEGDHQDKILRQTQTEENLDSKEFLLKDDLDLEENKTKIFSDRNAEKNSKDRRAFKSGIAKLRNSSKLKGYKSDEEQVIKNYKKETSQKEPNAVKRRHCCFPNDNTMGVSEKSSKILKTRNCTVVQQTLEPEKQQKSKYNTNPLVKKEEKTYKIKVQQGTDSQKFIKYNGKK